MNGRNGIIFRRQAIILGFMIKLKYYDEFYSRRINKYNRVVYKIDDIKKSVIIISLYGHYDN